MAYHILAYRHFKTRNDANWLLSTYFKPTAVRAEGISVNVWTVCHVLKLPNPQLKLT